LGSFLGVKVRTKVGSGLRTEGGWGIKRCEKIKKTKIQAAIVARE